MKKMSVTFHILTLLGVLLLPGFAQDNFNNVNITTTDKSAPNESITPGGVNMSTNEGYSYNISNNETLPSQQETQGSNNETKDGVFATNTIVPPEEETETTQGNSNKTKDGVFTTNTTVLPEQDNTDVGSSDWNLTKSTEGAITTGPGPTTTKKSTTSSTTKSTTAPARHDGNASNPVYVVVLILVILVIAVVAIIFFCVKANRRRFSVDIHCKNEDAQIPLAAVETEVCDASLTDMKTFMNDKETSPPPDSKEEGALPEADQQVKESPAETQTSEAPAEKPAEPNIVDETDGDPAASTKTSVETLNDVLNENNNNNNAERSVHALFFEIGLND
ncbi:protein let-653 [Silurus meridionalis]|uniref:Uncharacterized protein n=1 Tax=Silurus meridionalis TaxID=175797 RepID=A0A8T0BS08_SILME|nr:protein let-653 [Silurus meridionalis]KAF7710101.1 hypothetical protein HF521_008973 [Silurus meridionalis]